MFEIPSIRIALAFVLAIIPALLWGYFFYLKNPERKRDIARVFIAGVVSVAPLLLYKYLWQFFPWINAFAYTNTFSDDVIGFSTFAMIPINVLLTFMIVGVIEEIAKYLAVKNIHRKVTDQISDSMEYFIIAAIGFSFAENIIYFYNIMSVRGAEGVFLPFVFRSLFSTFAHIMFSGFMGYYYGLAHFAEPVMKEAHNKKRWKIVRYLSKKLGIKKETLFFHEKIAQGLFLAVGLHAIFNIMLEMNWTFLIVPFLTIGFFILTSLFENKQVEKNYYCIEA